MRPGRAGDDALALVDLLSDFGTLLQLTHTAIARRDWLDGFLLAAGASQIIDDYLHPDLFAANRIATRIDRAGWLGGAPRAGLLAAARVGLWLGERRQRQWFAWRRAWSSQVVLPLARAVAQPSAGGPALASVAHAAPRLAGVARGAPAALQCALVRLPSCFQSFDQRPEDVRWMIEHVAARSPDRARCMAVVGIRSSGSYLGPLARAYLEHAGYTNVVDLTLRPGHGLVADERAVLRSIAGRGGLALIVDDPPASGRALVRSAAAIEAEGLAPEAIVVLAPAFESPRVLPSELSRYQLVVQPWSQWAVHRQLDATAVRRTLGDLLRTAGEVLDVARVQLPPRRWPRDHLRARYAVDFRPAGEATITRMDVCAEGVGLGYFGAHALAVAERLGEFVPRLYGMREGILFREWLPRSSRVEVRQPAESHDRGSTAEAVAEYVVTRGRRLALSTDKSAALAGRDPVWELASHAVEQSFGRRASRPMRVVVQPAIRWLLRVEQPSLVDGATSPDRWFRADSTALSLRKISFAERDFSNLDAFSCDPVYDLAGAVPPAGDAEFEAALRLAFERRAGRRVDAERWLLYRLVHAQARLRIQPDAFVSVQDDNARALRTYYGETLLADCRESRDGPLCAIDIDGVLEVEPLGFPGLTPRAALGLRALAQHGYRSVVVTGRGLPEVQERCRAYKLSGGVAEYGAVVYDHRRGRTIELLTAAAADDLERVRTLLRQVPGVVVEADYARGVRAYHPGAAPYARRGLESALAAEMLTRAGVEGRVRAIHGQSQTDFMAVGTDKGSGLRALLGELGERRGRTALAVGDSQSDLPMLALADRAFAPANADSAVRAAGIQLTRGGFQLGFLNAVAAELGHVPGSCATCHAPVLSARTCLLNAILGAADRPRSEKLSSGVELAWRLATQARRT